MSDQEGGVLVNKEKVFNLEWDDDSVSIREAPFRPAHLINTRMTVNAGFLNVRSAPIPAGTQPVLRSPAEIPLIVAAMARLTSGVFSPARLRRSRST